MRFFACSVLAASHQPIRETIVLVCYFSHGKKKARISGKDFDRNTNQIVSELRSYLDSISQMRSY